MPSIEELLSQDSNDEYIDISPINDVITIDPETRTINLPASETLFGIEQEMDVERKYFKCPKIVGDNIDLSKHQIYIMYITAQDSGGVFLPEEESESYYCNDVAVDETGNYITFSWLLSGNVLSKAGFIAFAVCAKHMNGDVLKTRWKTKPAVGTVLLTVPDGASHIAEAYPDIIAQLLDKMNAVEEVATELGKNLAKEKMDREQADISLQQDISGKLSEPVEGLAVGKYFRVAQIDENGHAVLEAVDLPIASGNQFGVVRAQPVGTERGVYISPEGFLATQFASVSQINNRTNFNNSITPYNLDYAVKAAMCDGKGAAWTADEQAAARERIGIPGDYELIASVELTEDAKLDLNITTDTNGNVFSLKSIIINAVLMPTNVNTNFYIYKNNDKGELEKIFQSSSIWDAVDKSYFTMKISKYGERYYKSGSCYKYSNYLYDFGAYRVFNPMRLCNVSGTAEAVSGALINIINLLSGATCPAGCKFDVYGVRA